MEVFPFSSHAFPLFFLLLSFDDHPADTNVDDFVLVPPTASMASRAQEGAYQGFYQKSRHKPPSHL